MKKKNCAREAKQAQRLLKTKLMVSVMYQIIKGIITKNRTSTKRIIRTHTTLSILINSRNCTQDINWQELCEEIIKKLANQIRKTSIRQITGELLQYLTLNLCQDTYILDDAENIFYSQWYDTWRVLISLWII